MSWRARKKDVLRCYEASTLFPREREENGAVKSALAVEGMLGLDIETIQTTKDFEILGHIAEARRLMGEAMAPQIIEYVSDFLEGSSEKYVLFGWHLNVLKLYEEGLKHFGTVVVHGGKSPLARQAAIDEFISNPKVRVFIANMQSGGEV